MDTAYVNAQGEGLVCIDDVQELIWIHEKRSALETDFSFVSGETL